MTTSTPPPAGTPGGDLGRSLDLSRWPVRIGYLAILLMATLSKLEPTLNAGAVVDRAGRMLRPDLVPADLVDAARNLLLFAGWGLVWMATSGPQRSLRAFWLAVGSGAFISLAVETLQLLSDNRRASLLDVLTNSGGAFLGALTFVVAVRWIAGRRHARSYVGIPAVIFAAAYGIVVLGEAMVPYFRQEHLRVYGSPLNRLAFALGEVRPPSLGDLPLSEIVLFAPAGFFLVAALVEAGLGVRKSGLLAAVFGAVFIVAAEFAHGALSLAIRVGPILVHVAAVMLGALLAVAFLPRVARSLRGRERPQLLYAVYTVLLLPWFLRPYVPRFRPGAWIEELSGHWWMPMIFASNRMDFFSVVDVTNMFFLFLPLGCLLAVWPLRDSGWLRGILPGVLLALLFEGMQIFVAGRTLALADMLIGIAGVWVGWVLVRRAGFPVRGVTLAG